VATGRAGTAGEGRLEKVHARGLPMVMDKGGY